MPDPDAEVKEGEEPPTKSVPRTTNVWEKVHIVASRSRAPRLPLVVSPARRRSSLPPVPLAAITFALYFTGTYFVEYFAASLPRGHTISPGLAGVV